MKCHYLYIYIYNMTLSYFGVNDITSTPCAMVEIEWLSACSSIILTEVIARSA